MHTHRVVCLHDDPLAILLQLVMSHHINHLCSALRANLISAVNAQKTNTTEVALH